MRKLGNPGMGGTTSETKEHIRIPSLSFMDRQKKQNDDCPERVYVFSISIVFFSSFLPRILFLDFLK